MASESRRIGTRCKPLVLCDRGTESTLVTLVELIIRRVRYWIADPVQPCERQHILQILELRKTLHRWPRRCKIAACCKDRFFAELVRQFATSQSIYEVARQSYAIVTCGSRYTSWIALSRATPSAIGR